MSIALWNPRGARARERTRIAGTTVLHNRGTPSHTTEVPYTTPSFSTAGHIVSHKRGTPPAHHTPTEVPYSILYNRGTLLYAREVHCLWLPYATEVPYTFLHKRGIPPHTTEVPYTVLHNRGTPSHATEVPHTILHNRDTPSYAQWSTVLPFSSTESFPFVCIIMRTKLMSDSFQDEDSGSVRSFVSGWDSDSD
jgi:hypothetical protein